MARQRDPQAQSVLGRYGRGALLPFLDRADKRWFYVPGATDENDPSGGLVVFGRAGRVVVALGDPIGDVDDAWRTFNRFVAACDLHGWIPGVYQASETARECLAAGGFRCIPIGQEAVIELADFHLAGSRRANLRHTLTRSRRGGIRVDWYPEGVDPDRRDALLPALTAIDHGWRTAAGPTLGFTISQFEAASVMAPAAVAIAVDASERPVAFATFRPTGADRGSVLDLMRRLPGSEPGALESCVATAAQSLAAAGVPRLSLGLAPLAGLDERGATMEERLLARAANLVAPAYDVAGLAFFKGKFDPRWEPRYLAARRPLDVIAVALALLRLHLVPPGTTISAAVRRAFDELLTGADPAAGPPFGHPADGG